MGAFTSEDKAGARAVGDRARIDSALQNSQSANLTRVLRSRSVALFRYQRRRGRKLNAARGRTASPAHNRARPAE